MAKNRNKKIFKHSSKTLFTRKGNKITNTETKETENYKSINMAKREVRKLIDKHGLGSVRLQ
jgi:hypothetical protein